MNSSTKAAIRKVCQRAAVRVNNLYATAYMDVQTKAGPGGEKHDADVAGVIEEEVGKVFMAARTARQKP